MKGTDSKFRQMAMLGEKLDDERIVDVHTHTGGLSRVYHLPDASTEDMIAEMDRHGIDLAITFPFSSAMSDFVYANDGAIVAANRYPDRLIGFACVNPHYHTDIRAEMERCKAAGLRGIKLIGAYQLYPSEGRNFFPAYEFAHENSWMMLNHNWGSPQFLDEIAGIFSSACFIIGHYSTAYADVIAKHENIYQCTCAALNFGQIEELLDLVPADRIVYGSDFPDLPMMFSMAPILYSRISDDDKRKILGLTANAMIEKWPGK